MVFASKHYIHMNIYDRERLVERMSLKHAHVGTLRKRIRTKIKKRKLRSAFLLHICTFVLILAYLSDLISNSSLLEANHGMLNFIQQSSFTTTTHNGHQITKTIDNIGSVRDLELWMKKFVLQKILIESQPYYFDINDLADNSDTTTGSDDSIDITANVSLANKECPCITEYPPTETAGEGTLDGNVIKTIDTYGLNFCATHDKGQPPFCAVTDDSSTPVPGYCSEPWCYVDQENCNLKATLSSFFPTMTYSYETCNAANKFTGFVANKTYNENKVISALEFNGKYLVLWGIRFRQIRVMPINRTANDGLLEHACLVHRKTNENFYDIDYATSQFGDKTYGWLTSTCYPEWSNTFAEYIESGANDALKTNAYNYNYHDPAGSSSGNKSRAPMRGDASTYQETFHNSYPNRGWSSVFLLEDHDQALHFDKTMSNGKFIDEQTRVVMVEFTTYLPTSGVFTSVRILFELHISGGISYTPVVTSAQFDNFETVSNLRLFSGVLLTVINIYGMARGLKDFCGSINSQGEFVFYGWDMIEVINEILMLMLVYSLWNELVSQQDYKVMRKMIAERYIYVDATPLIKKRRNDIQTFALNAFLVSIRFAQFFKLSRELKFVWRGIKTSISNVCQFVLYLLLPCLFISVSSAFVIFGPHVLSMSHFTKVFVAVARLIFKDDSFNIFMKHLIQSVVSNSLVALFLFSIALLYTVVLFSFLQAIIFDSWQTLVISKIKSTETFDPSKKNDAYFTRYLYGVVVLPFTLLVNLCSVQFWTNDALNELKRIFGIHSGPIETDVPWIDMLEALESLKLEQATISYAVYRDSLAALMAQRQVAKEAADSGGTKKENKPKIITGEDVVGFHVAVAFLQIEFIGGVWDEEGLEKYKAMDHEEQDVLNRMLYNMARSNERIDTVHVSDFLSRKDALAATMRKMEELNPYSQQGYKRIQLRNMLSRLNRLNQESIKDSTKLCETLEATAKTHLRASRIIVGIGQDMDGIDSGKTHDTSVAVQISHGDKDAATKLNAGGEILEYDSTW